MADKATKIKIVSWCLMVALCVFSGALCLYFFVFNRAPNERGYEIYVDLNEVLTSENQSNINSSLGYITEQHNAQIYAGSSASGELGKKFNSLFLCYCVDREIVDTYKYEIAFLSNADFKLSVKLDNAVKDYKLALNSVQSYLKLFNDSYIKLGGATSEETKNNFRYMLDNFENLENANHTLAMGVIDYVGKIYYGFEKDLNPYSSEKYALTFALSCESNTIYSCREQLGSDTVTYIDAKTQLQAYTGFKSAGFKTQETDTKMINFLNLMIYNAKVYIPFLESGNKNNYYQSASSDVKTKLAIIAKGIGVDGRISL